MVSKALVVGVYQKKLEEVAKFADIHLTAVVPHAWGNKKFEKVHVNGYKLINSPITFNGNFHLHYYPHLKQILGETQPDIIHIDEEPYNLATFHAMRLARKYHIKTVVFSWQNIKRFYPPPFNLMEKYVLHHANALIVGNAEARLVWQKKGYKGLLYEIPQFGVDPTIFYRHERVKRKSRLSMVVRQSVRKPSQPTLVISFVGRLVPEKGVDILLNAAAKLKGPWMMKILGDGSERNRLEHTSQWLGIGGRVKFDEPIASTMIPHYLSGLDVLVLPSISRRNWKEQFGRVLIEAMACGVITIGSRSGAIPQVIGSAGLLFEEGNVDDLQRQLQRLIDDVALRQTLREAGRERVINHYTQSAIAHKTVEVYHAV